MAQWTNLQLIKRFINPTQPYITCEKSEGLRRVSQQAGSEAAKIWSRFEILKACFRLKIFAL